MDGPPKPHKKRETPSDRLRHATVSEYLQAHTKPNGSGWKGFLHSNLFSALLVWSLSQALIAAGVIVTVYMRMGQFSEWKGGAEKTFSRMDAEGTLHSHYSDEQQDKQLAKHEVRLDKLEEVTRHSEVNEFEVRQLRKEVEDARNGKK